MFSKIIALQFAVSMLVLCSNLYRIATTSSFVVFISLMIYMGAILAQIFIYCWFGNEVKTKVYDLSKINFKYNKNTKFKKNWDKYWYFFLQCAILQSIFICRVFIWRITFITKWNGRHLAIAARKILYSLWSAQQSPSNLVACTYYH